MLLGLTYLGVTVSFTFEPPEQQLPNDTILFLQSFAQHPMAREIFYVCFALGAFLAFAVIPAVFRMLKPVHEGLAQWTAGLAYLGFAAVALGNCRAFAEKPLMAAMLAPGDGVTKTILRTIDPLLVVDPTGWLGRAGVGLWVLTAALLCWRRKLLPRLLCVVGVVVALCYWATMLAAATERMHFGTAMVVAAGSLTIISPIWYIWLGVELRKRMSTTVS